jgi:hypothetical protein
MIPTLATIGEEQKRIEAIRNAGIKGGVRWLDPNGKRKRQERKPERKKQ